MKQPIKNTSRIKNKTKKGKFAKDKINVVADGSGLETFFRVNILDVLEIKYQQQFKAESIGRFYDFYLPEHNVLLEIDGGYWHLDPRLYEAPINSIQKRNKRVDELKNKWALTNGYVLLRFWESDIKKSPGEIIKFLIDRLKIEKDVVLLKESKKNGSFYNRKK